MGFSKTIKEDVNVASARHCCVCHRYKGVKVEIHHIIPKKQGGADTFENAIMLCFDCHSDAGHYFANHPKGTKFSIAELKKHKAAWYSIVLKNQIPQKKENIIHSRFILTHEFDVIRELFERDLKNFPVNNVLFFETKVWKDTKRIFDNQLYRNTEIQKTIKYEIEDYTTKYPNATKLINPEGEYSFYIHQRPASIDDIQQSCTSDKLTTYLAQNGIEPNRLVRVFTHQESECGGGEGHVELFQLRPAYFKFLIITNISDAHISLSRISVQKKFDALYKLDDNLVNEIINLPKILLQPNQSVLIPIGILMSDFKEIQKSNNYLEYSHTGRERTQQFGHGSSNGEEIIEYVLENYFPTSIEFEVEGAEYSNDLHDFDFNNVYWLDRSWECGSCPHVFFILENSDLKYQGEIFNVNQGVVCSAKFTITKSINKLIICELEEETTYINSILRNGTIINTNIILRQGEELVISVFENDKIEIIGYYLLNSKTTRTLSIFKKEQLVQSYRKKLSLTKGLKVIN